MRFFRFLSHTVNFINISTPNYLKCWSVARNKMMSTMSKGGTGEEPIESNDINNLNLVYGFIKTSKEEPKKFNEKELNSYDDYIKVKDVYTFHDFITS